VLSILISAAAAMAIGAESVTATVAFILVALVGLCALVAARRFKSCF
jgi:hypothetical protein